MLRGIFAVALTCSSLAGATSGVEVPTVPIAAGVRMPAVSIGTGGLEGARAEDIVATWLGLGGRGLDAAWIYRNQDSVRAAVAKGGVARKDLFITSKIPGCVSAKSFIEADLQQLAVEYIDLMLIHTPRPSTEHCPETWAVLEHYHKTGVLKAIGVSNFKASDLSLLLQTASVVPAVNQIQHNVLAHDDDTIAFCRDHNITVEAYSPLGRAGRTGDIPGNKQVQAIAAAHNVSAYQVALRWILQHGHVLTFQSSSAAHQEADADVFGFELEAEEMDTLDKLQDSSASESTLVV